MALICFTVIFAEYYFIVETDYDNFALHYLCTNYTGAICHPDSIIISILSRYTDPDSEKVNEYLQIAVQKLCGTEEDFIESDPPPGMI